MVDQLDEPLGVRRDGPVAGVAELHVPPVEDEDLLASPRPLLPVALDRAHGPFVARIEGAVKPWNDRRSDRGRGVHSLELAEKRTEL